MDFPPPVVWLATLPDVGPSGGYFRERQLTLTGERARRRMPPAAFRHRHTGSRSDR